MSKTSLSVLDVAYNNSIYNILDSGKNTEMKVIISSLLVATTLIVDPMSEYTARLC